MSLVHIGIALAFVAMLSWGVGDFFIQKSARKVGDWEALFFITFLGALFLLPFAYKNVIPVFSGSSETILVIAILCIVLFIAAIFDFEALRVGKLAIVEPVWSFEVPVSALLAFFIIGERINMIQICLIVVLLLGLALVSIKNEFSVRKLIFEKGTIIAFFAAILMGAANFFMGWSSRLSDPITANFLSDVFIVAITGIYLLFSGRLTRLFRDFNSNKGVILLMSIPDKVAWVAFAFAMSLAPIGVVVALSESYIIIAVILGLAVNKEKIKFHQKSGLVLAIFSAIILASITG
jgi:drug/metabolite transporter (DMT)-like permease